MPAPNTSELLDEWRNLYERPGFLPAFEEYKRAKVAILDDIGAQKVTDWVLDRLWNYLEFRYNRALPTAISTNLDKEGMIRKLDERIADRVFDRGTGLVQVVTLDVLSFRTGRDPRPQSKPEGGVDNG